MLAVSTGDPAGVGPEVSLRATRALLRSLPGVRVTMFGDADRLTRRWSAIAQGATASVRDRVTFQHVADWPIHAVEAHAPSAILGDAQLRALDAATDMVSAGRADALVTAPISKEAVVSAGHHFNGHTEHLAARCGLPRDAVSMLFLGKRLRVGLVTMHIAVRDVGAELTPERVCRTAVHLGEALLRLSPGDGAKPGTPEHAMLSGVSALSGLPTSSAVSAERARELDASQQHPPTHRVLVAGLNPHAGEHGLFGDEEVRIIAPGIARAREACAAWREEQAPRRSRSAKLPAPSGHDAETTPGALPSGSSAAALASPCLASRLAVEGPVPSESAFRHALDRADIGVVAMMHDHATIACKLVDWGHSVNVTWGLPFVRTSVDHGVAYQAAAEDTADFDGMLAALRCALELVQGA